MHNTESDHNRPQSFTRRPTRGHGRGRGQYGRRGYQYKCGFWNINGWSRNANSDKNALLESCINSQDLHIVGIAETHLVNDSVINVDNYEWFGNNRKHIHIRAKTGSGGVGILVKKDLLSTFKVTIGDNSEDGILWIRFTEIGKSYNCFYVCVVYLPPEFSARSVNAHNFFDVLMPVMEQIYTIPNGNLFLFVWRFQQSNW